MTNTYDRHKENRVYPVLGVKRIANTTASTAFNECDIRLTVYLDHRQLMIHCSLAYPKQISLRTPVPASNYMKLYLNTSKEHSA